MSVRIANIGVKVGAIDALSAKPAQKRAIPIYTSSAHRAWRNAVIASAGGRCQWPECGRAEKRLFADHIVELQDDGAAFDVANGQCLCGRHHTMKTNIERVRRHGAATV